MPPFIVYLLGFPGVGKYTVGEALAAQSGALLIDNHVVNNPILALFKSDQIPMEAFARTAPIRDAVFAALEEIAPRETSYVLTNVLGEDPYDVGIYQRLEGIARARGSVFLPVMVTCARETQLQRVQSPERSRRQKLSDPAVLERLMATTRLYSPPDPNLLTLDTTVQSPEESGARVMERLKEL